ncbi:potassium-transporting ATPase subunit KdpC [Microbacterium sp. dk485]|uniref:Potassium-transporting ATPase KdpC subunit n=1 Tax=Microbacterium wangchenii TaxID=2541726 RepID=A0ABX5SPW4_9MICO|nr:MULTISPECIES: potassium-transporting ATPase subunit KdpC [Microbacterium]MCK6066324.1 potassium-transporting ATPase subunit KdpC [Microbacterium sp. EYE_512]QBR87297.1 potassium-transporting ATPase subunit KdpC [Microbacterium wangchenii]TFV84600.1 potassium-transporting ATPase subunit KdpC [Microbacterium sp. dk485]TXK14618.1 potassium-transporting ATPase subunit KdpC [Microbacterium wangchenii]
MTTARTSLRTTGVAVRAMLVLTAVLGVGYVLLITAVGQLALPHQANGSLVRDGDGVVVGSELIGQGWTDAEGAPLPEYFQSRPSAAGDGYDGAASSGSNLGPENDDLVAAIEERRSAIADGDGVAPGDIPADAVTASGSGLDPDISAEYAALQADRVAAARGIPTGEVQELVRAHVQQRDLGFLGEERVNVLELNRALDALQD